MYSCTVLVAIIAGHLLENIPVGRFEEVVLLGYCVGGGRDVMVECPRGA